MIMMAPRTGLVTLNSATFWKIGRLAVAAHYEIGIG